VLTRLSLLFASTALCILAKPAPASAACVFDCWTGATSADWFVGTNWTTGTPTSATNVVIDQRHQQRRGLGCGRDRRYHGYHRSGDAQYHQR
jgi:hypothetical protein